MKFNFISDCLCFRSKDKFNWLLGSLAWLAITGIDTILSITTYIICQRYE